MIKVVFIRKTISGVWKDVKLSGAGYWGQGVKGGTDANETIGSVQRSAIAAVGGTTAGKMPALRFATVVRVVADR